MKNNNYKKTLQLLSLIMGFVLFVACEKDANVKLPKVDQKLVILSFISPQDSIIKVQLSLSQPLYNTSKENAYRPVQDANVTITSIFGVQTLHYDATLKGFIIDTLQLKIRAGVKYILSVSTPDGKKAIASTQIPEQNTSLTLEVKPEDEFESNYSVRAFWQDPSAEENYYRLFLQMSGYYVFYSSDQSGNTYEDTIRNTSVLDELLDDTKKPGGQLTNTWPMSYFKSNDDTYFYLLNLSKEYYDYHEKLYPASNSGNPFSEPIQMYTNVEGGFGIFAGFNSYRVKVEP